MRLTVAAVPTTRPDSLPDARTVTVYEVRKARAVQHRPLAGDRCWLSSRRRQPEQRFLAVHKLGFARGTVGLRRRRAKHQQLAATRIVVGLAVVSRLARQSLGRGTSVRTHAIECAARAVIP